MGLLDDAIKEHLELKRRRGADAEEVARLEQEALGPPQRGEFAGAATPAEGGRRRRGCRGPGRARAGHGRARRRRTGARARPASGAGTPEPEPEPADHTDEAWLDERAGAARRAGGGERRRPPRPAHRRVQPRPPIRRPRARTSSRRPRTSCRRRRSTTGCGSSRSRRATSTSTDSRAPLHPPRRLHRPAAGRQRAGGRPRRRRPLRRAHARLRARDEAVGDLVRPVAGPEAQRADYRHRIFMMTGEIPFAGHPSLGVAAAVARARGEAQASYVQQTQPGEQAVDVELEGLRARVSMLQEPPAFGPELDPAEVLGLVGLSAADADPRLPCQVVATGVPQVLACVADASALAPRRRPTTRASGPCSPPTRRSRSTSRPSTPRPAGPARAPSSPRPRWARTRPPARPSARCARTSPRARAPSGSRGPGHRDGPPERAARRDRGRPRPRGRGRGDPGRGRRPSGRVTDLRAPALLRAGRAAEREITPLEPPWTGRTRRPPRTPGRGILPDTQRWFPPAPGRSSACPANARSRVARPRPRGPRVPGSIPQIPSPLARPLITAWLRPRSVMCQGTFPSCVLASRRQRPSERTDLRDEH